MRIAVFGLGYVGVVSAACFAEMGHDVIGVDVSPDKVAAVNEGRSPVVEEGIGALIHEMVAARRLRATHSAHEAVEASDIALVCVGTPSEPSGALNTAYLERVVQDIGDCLPSHRPYVVVLRSTMLPGTCDLLLKPLLKAAAAARGQDETFVCVHPEFLREGSSVHDFYHPPKIVIGADGDLAAETLAALYAGFSAPLFVVPTKVAEMTKYVDNTFHALKVAFANEIGAVCKSNGIDSHRVMDIFKSDNKLNISPAYLTPGGPFGGSCLPKDLRALTYGARHSDLDTPLLGSILPSNDAHLGRTFRTILSDGRKRVGIFGLAFKQGTDDLRESPMVHLAELLVGRGYDLLIHDSDVAESHLLGANKAYVEAHIPHLAALMRSSAQEVMRHAEICVVSTRSSQVVTVLGDAGQRLVVDLVRAPELEHLPQYDGACW